MKPTAPGRTVYASAVAALAFTLGPALLLAPPTAVAQEKVAPGDSGRRAAEAARRETQRAEASANQADARVKRAEEGLRAAQIELDTARKEQRAAQQRLSGARSEENRAQRALDAQPRAR